MLPSKVQHFQMILCEQTQVCTAMQQHAVKALCNWLASMVLHWPLPLSHSTQGLGIRFRVNPINLNKYRHGSVCPPVWFTLALFQYYSYYPLFQYSCYSIHTWPLYLAASLEITAPLYVSARLYSSAFFYSTELLYSSATFCSTASKIADLLLNREKQMSQSSTSPV